MSASSSASSNRKVVIAIVATFAITVIIVSLFFFLCDRYARRRRRNRIDPRFKREAVVSYEEFRRFGKKVKGLIVEENGQDVIYVMDLEDRKLKTKFSNVVENPSFEDERVIEDMAMNRTTKCIPQEVKAKVTESVQPNIQSMGMAPTAKNVETSSLTENVPSQLESPLKPTTLPPPPPPPSSMMAKRHSVPPPPPLPAMIAKKHSVPPPPKAGGLVSSLRPPSVPRWSPNNKNGALGSIEDSCKGTSAGNMKLKPLHWDKVTANADHSMVWNEIIDGSLRFDDNQIESLFGYTTASRKTSPGNGVPSSISSSSPAATTQSFILESRKSHNTAIVLKSLAVSRKEILDSLLDGQGLATDVLEKLARIAPTQEEETKILQFNGNPTKLADAEFFLYYILKAVPSAFIRINAMLFRSNYDAEILHHKKSLQTLELGCKELRTRGLFLKLLEAILKAGNKMNAGTSRGNAQGFNLTALRKISDVKSNDGKSTLLHFVVEQVVQSEGKRCSLNQNRTIERNNSQRQTNNESSPGIFGAEKDREHLQLGLQALKQLSTEFSNVKRAATIDYNSFINTCSSLKASVTEIRQLITQCGNGNGSGFVKEMKGFIEETEEEIKVVEEEQTRIMELVKKTTDYYQAGATKQERANLLQLFSIVKDFLAMVDSVSVGISQKMQKRNGKVGSTSPTLIQMRAPMKFQDFRVQFNIGFIKDSVFQ